MTLTILIFLISFFVLVRSAAYLVTGLTRLAKILGISEFLLAFILMSAATSMSELFVGISSASQNTPLLSFGNILGANFINIVLILGIVAVISNGFEIKKKMERKNFWLVFGLALLPIFLALDGSLSRIDGIILLASFFLYISRLLKEKIYFSEIFNNISINNKTAGEFLKEFTMVILGLILLIASSGFVVYAGKSIAEAFNFGIFVFGLIFISLGTTLPELVFGLKAASLKHPDLAVGNSLGSIAFNSSFILGLVSFINPFQIALTKDLILISIFLIFALILFHIFIYTKGRLTAKQGYIFLFIYLFFLAVKFIL